MGLYAHDTSERIDQHRMLKAADALLDALAQDPHGDALVDVCMGDPRRGARNSFTADELVEAMRFLFRTGLAEPLDSPETRFPGRFPRR